MTSIRELGTRVHRKRQSIGIHVMTRLYLARSVRRQFYTADVQSNASGSIKIYQEFKSEAEKHINFALFALSSRQTSRSGPIRSGKGGNRAPGG
jgi:hypothetical protein